MGSTSLRKLFRGRKLIEKSLEQWVSEREQILEQAPPDKTPSLVGQKPPRASIFSLYIKEIYNFNDLLLRTV